MARSHPAPEAELARAHTLPSRLYTDLAALAAEKERVFSRTWQLVGREEQAARPGQFFPLPLPTSRSSWSAGPSF